MLESIKKIRNAGRLRDCPVGPKVDLPQITLVYACNALGKTTLTAILRSLATGDPAAVVARRSLPHGGDCFVALGVAGGACVFRDGAWVGDTPPQLLTFDSEFIRRNVHSGYEVQPEHRRNLGSLMLGEKCGELERTREALTT
ncbi:MAG TPA: hypothetical protein QGH10_05315 [Armatimonadota bacterium]|nr:hypothetical protein [Armatimonadota bacterium]